MARRTRPNGLDNDDDQNVINARTALILEGLSQQVQELRTLVIRGLIWGVGFLLSVIGVLAGALFKLK